MGRIKGTKDGSWLASHPPCGVRVISTIVQLHSASIVGVRAWAFRALYSSGGLSEDTTYDGHYGAGLRFIKLLFLRLFDVA